MHHDEAGSLSPALGSLRAGLRGDLIAPDSPRYDAARGVWNARVDRRPAAIARCVGVADVLTAVRWARAHAVPVAVRGGGHDVAGSSVRDGGLVIDLSAMKGVRVDPARRTVRAQAGLTWRELDHETQAFGLATTGGQCSATGVAGVTLGGGFGWLMRQHGLTIDNLLAVDLVTADGRLVTASADTNPELFWGVRGGGGNFGIVTELELRLHSVTAPLFAILVHPAERLADALRFYHRFADAEPDAMTSALFYLELPPLPQLPASLHGAPGVAFLACHDGPLADGEAALAPLRAFGPPLAELVGPMPYAALQRSLDSGPAADYGYGQAVRTQYLATLDDDAIATIVAGLRAAPSPGCVFQLAHLEGAIARVGEDATAFPGRASRYFSLFQASWRDPADADRHLRWTRDAGQALRRFASAGAPVHFIDGDEPPARVQEVYGAAKLQRLAALKRVWDPTSFFRSGRDVAP